MTGTAVQLSSRALGCNWPGLTGHGGSCRTEQCVYVCVCGAASVCLFAEEDAGVLPPRRHNG